MSIKTIILILTTTMMMNGCKGQTQAPVVRQATQANRFYTGDARELSEEVDSFLALHKDDAKYSHVAALIVPHAGYYFSGNVAASAYMAIDPRKQYKRIFLLGPSHHEWLDGASVNTEADYYATPLGHVKVDHETAMALTNTNLTNSDSVFSYRAEAHDSRILILCSATGRRRMTESIVWRCSYRFCRDFSLITHHLSLRLRCPPLCQSLFRRMITRN